MLVRFLGPEAREVIDYIDKDWSTEEYSGGCYCPGTSSTTAVRMARTQ